MGADGKTKEYLDEPTGEWVGKKEHKNRLTQRKKESDKVAKAAEKAKVEDEK